MLHRFPFPTHRQWRCPTHRLLRKGNRSSHPQRCEPACRRSNSLSLESQEAVAGTTPLERSLQSPSHDERKQSLPPTMPDGRMVRFLKDRRVLRRPRPALRFFLAEPLQIGGRRNSVVSFPAPSREPFALLSP